MFPDFRGAPYSPRQTRLTRVVLRGGQKGRRCQPLEAWLGRARGGGASGGGGVPPILSPPQGFPPPPPFPTAILCPPSCHASRARPYRLRSWRLAIQTGLRRSWLGS